MFVKIVFYTVQTVCDWRINQFLWHLTLPSFWRSLEEGARAFWSGGEGVGGKKKRLKTTGIEGRLCYLVSSPVTISNISRYYTLLQIQGDSVVSDMKAFYLDLSFLGSKRKHGGKREDTVSVCCATDECVYPASCCKRWMNDNRWIDKDEDKWISLNVRFYGTKGVCV